MNIIHTEAYRAAFAEYLRKGTPIRLTLKPAGLSDQYVWRTQRDERVRRSHRMNDGRVFSWADAPATGHPGEDYNCRCEAVPYSPGETEFGSHEFTTSLASSYDRWIDLDFMWHYRNGSGRSVDLLEIGHLREIAEQYAYGDGVEGAFRRLADQIADEARGQGPGAIRYAFGNVYDFGPVAYSHGDGVVRGEIVGFVEYHGVMLRISGDSRFQFSDKFADPLGMGLEVDGTPYPVMGSWTASFSAEVLKDPARSNFGSTGRR